MNIGFVDHHLNNFHANKFVSLLHGPLAELGARVTLAWESDPSGDDWCAKNGIARAESAAAVAEQSDVVMVLAPDNIEAHPALCREVLRFGKPTFVDKFLATTADAAAQIIGSAGEHGAPLFSASALRFAVELEAMRDELQAGATDAFSRGMGEWEGYGVHTLSLVFGGLGSDVKRVINTGTEKSAVVTLDYEDGRRASLDVRTAANQWETLPWAFGFRVGEKYLAAQVADFDGFYANLMRRAVLFFQSGESIVTPAEMLMTVNCLEAADRSREAGGTWIDVGA